ncbi:MAG TPA: NUDIX hydrolase [Thermoplasmata archaeon]|nr:NUDIX hydrolase [Thermoplasmata archaeon]
MAERRFARLRAGGLAGHPGAAEVPYDGMCLSVFLIVRPEGRSGEVLLGRIDPSADWATIGGLDPGRVAQIATRWMLPSSQLLFFESPTEAAERIAREQLGVPLPGLTGPATFSEAYRRPGSAGDPHWDLHFIYEARWPTARFPASRPFSELAFVEAARTPRAEIARSQADILALVGLATAP